jgi:hypothetical protein
MIIHSRPGNCYIICNDGVACWRTLGNVVRKADNALFLLVDAWTAMRAGDYYDLHVADPGVLWW